MNPANKDIEFLLRRITETFPDWAVGLPVLFGFLVLFIIATFRRDKGVVGLFCGLGMFFVVPLLLASRPDKAANDFFQDVFLLHMRQIVGGIVSGSFMIYAWQELSGRKKFDLIGGGLALGMLVTFVLFWEPLDAPIHLKVLPAMVLFVAQVIYTAWQARLLWGIAAVTVLSAVYVPLALMFKPVFSWWVVLAPTLGAALFYVGMMYFHDARSIHPVWAVFLGMLRCAVYAILAFVFLLPGCQTYDTLKFFPKILVLFDVSGSMINHKDDEPGQDPKTLKTRQEKVVEFLAAAQTPDKKPRTPFFDALVEKSPLSVYRFGGIADDINVLQFDAEKNKIWPEEAMREWLIPDKKGVDKFLGEKEKKEEEEEKEKKVKKEKMSPEEKAKYRARLLDLYDSLAGGTNVGGSVNQVAKNEAGSYVQAMIIVSDGQSNLGSSDSVKEFLARVNNPKRKINVFTIGVGDYRQPASILVQDLQAPQTARPDDKFPLRVPVVGTGLADEEFEVFIDVTRVKDGQGNPLKGAEKAFTLQPKRGKFKPAGDYQQDTVEFEIDLQDLKGIKSSEDKDRILEGEWEIVARVPRHARESFTEAEHKSNPPTRVQVQNKELRVLLFAGGPTRDYQFLRTLLYREVQEKRMELSVYLQQSNQDDVDQDVPGERLLKHFPNRLGQDDPTDKYSSLNMYDVIIAIDADWSALEAGQLKLVEQWVGRDSGGVIFVGGPVYTYLLSRNKEELKPVKTILPVVLKDFRLNPAGLGQGVDTSRPYPLKFKPKAFDVDFLKLDETAEKWDDGWNRFFWGEAKKPETADARPRLGIHNFYPVDKPQLGAEVLATFSGPEITRINDGKDEMPYLATMMYGSGKTVFLGSGETWRLRNFKESFHERFWIKMARFAAAGSTQQKKYGRILLGRKVPTGNIGFEAQIKGSDLLPMPRDQKPVVFVKKRNDPDAKPVPFELRAKPTQGDWHGWFMGAWKVKEPGEYEFSIPIPNTTEALSHTLEVYKPDLEMANLRENHKELYQLATDAGPVLSWLKDDRATQDEIRRLLQPISDDIRDGKEGTRLFFPLKHADAVAKCLQKLDPDVERTKGALSDLWDQGNKVPLFHILWSVPLALGVLAFFIALFHERYLLAIVTGVAAGAVPLLIVAGDWLFAPEWLNINVDFSFVLVTVIGLLSVEWLTRKLLKLA